jgi:hypothetical protein
MFRRAALVVVFLLAVAGAADSQSTGASITGRVTDPTKAVILNANIRAINAGTNVSYTGTTNGSGDYYVTNLPPGTYRIEVEKAGFQTVIKPDVVLHVQDALEINFDMALGSASESITVEAGAPIVNTQDAAVSTVVDRNFAENLPLNGRSFQTLIQLTPGVVLTVNNGLDQGQFSVNGQRASSNYWMVDGVSANFGMSATSDIGNGLGGTLGSFSVLGGTNSLVSVDALQEFRIQTSTYAPEFGRTPGAQISIVTRSGTSQFHGSAFDYVRNDIFDANDWFADREGLPKPKERQNDFGGTFSGPIVKNKTFFFFSYEGLRLRLPQVSETLVPDASARASAVPALQPYLNAYPLPTPNAPDNETTGVAQFNASYSNPGTLSAYSLRIDHKVNDDLSVFARYNYSPSQLVQRGVASNDSLSTVLPDKITTQTATGGIIWNLSPAVVNDFRFNYSSANASSYAYLDNFGGAVPLPSLPLPSPLTAENAVFRYSILSLGSSGAISAGGNAHNQQRQINVVDSVSLQVRSHTMKFGVDFRRLSPNIDNFAYLQEPFFFSVPQAGTGDFFVTALSSGRNGNLLFRNLGMFAQDTWRMSPRITLTYGLRWDVDFAPSSTSGPKLSAVTGFNLSNLSQLALAPTGTPPFVTPYGNVAPRIGIAYQVSQSSNWQTVLRGGFGVFYDLATSEAGNGSLLSETSYPFFAEEIILGTPFGGTATFPLSSAQAAAPAIVPPNATNGQTLYGFDPHLELPYTLQWNVAIEQALGKQQEITASYVGAVGRRLIQTASISSPNPNYGMTQLVTNGAVSNYNALQIQFQRRLSRGLQVLASYGWSHSIDTASAGSLGSGSNALASVLNAALNRGPSDFDIRNSFSMGLTYDVPGPRINAFTNAILGGWSTENVFQARSAPPVNIYYSGYSELSDGFATSVRPNVVSGQPFYLYGSQYPGGKAFNPAAFAAPPIDSTTGLPLSEGDLPRNALRGFGAAQWDFAVHRDFQIHESLKLQFRAELFNVLNHPNFGQPIGDLGSPTAINPQFGESQQMLGQSLGGTFGVGSGGLNALYQMGGPRSVQLALKLSF